MESASTTLPPAGESSPLALDERRAAVREIVERFEQAWQESGGPSIDDYLPLHPELRVAALAELAQVDLERRLKAGSPARSEEYFSRYAELAADGESAVELISTEYELRRRQEPSLSINEMLARFPEHAKELSRSYPAPLYSESISPSLMQERASGDSSNTLAESRAAGDSSSWRPPSAAIVLRCPDCQATITLQSSPSGEMRCPSCAGLFRVEPENGDGARGEALTQIGKFRLLERIGRGAFGAVYRAHDLDLDRIVAVKIPRSGAFSSIEEEDRFVREARSVAKLSHPAIVPVFDVGRTDSFPYIVCEYVEGVTLARALAHRRFEFRDAAELAALVADALDHAHKNGVVHRDLKPSNIMVKPRPRYSASRAKPDDLRVRLMDFGLARREDGEATVTVQGQILGTPAYMSPEQARGEAYRVDGRADVYSLGALLYEMLVGEPPFRGNVRMLLHQVLHDEPRPLRKLNDRIPRDLETICLKCLEKRADQRYQTAGELAADLRRWMNNEPILARPLGSVERALRWAQRRPALAAMSALLVVTVAAAFVAITWQWKQTDDARRLELSARLNAQEAHRLEQDSSRKLEIALKDKQAALLDAQKERAEADRARSEVEDRLQRVSQAHRLASASENERADHPIRSLLLAAEALKLTDRPGERRVLEAEQSLRDALSSPGAETPSGFEGPFESVALASSTRFGLANPAQQWLIARTNAQTLVCRRLEVGTAGAAARQGATREPASFTLRDESGYLTAMTSPDGRWLAAVNGDDELQIASLVGAHEANFKLAFHRFPIGQPAFEGELWVAAFSPDGRWFAAAGQDRQLRVWPLANEPGDASEPGEPIVLSGPSLSIRQVAFSADSRRLLTASYDRFVRIYPLSDGAGGDSERQKEDSRARDELIGEPKVLQVGRVPEAYFAPRGRWLLTTAGDGGAALWDLDDPHLDSPSMTKLLGRIVTPSPDGRWMVVHTESLRPGLYSLLWIWRMPDAAAAAPVIQPPIRLHLRIGSVVRISPDGRFLAAIPSDGSVRVWRLDGDDPSSSFRDMPGDDALSLCFSDDSRLLTVGGEGGDVRLWRAEGEGWSQTPESFPGYAGVTSLAIDRRLGRLAVGDRDGLLRVFAFDPASAGNFEPPAAMRRHEETLVDLSFASGGRWLVSTSEDGDSRLWDLARLDSRLSPFRPPGRSVAGPPPIESQAAGADAGVFLQAEGAALALWDLSRAGVAGPSRVLAADAFQPIAADVSVRPGEKTRWLAAADAMGELRVWALQENADEAGVVEPSVQRLAVPSTDIEPLSKTPSERPTESSRVAFSPGGEWLANCDAKHVLGLWRRKDDEWRAAAFTDPPPAIGRFWFAGERWLVTASPSASTSPRGEASLLLWDLAAAQANEEANVGGPIALGGASVASPAAVAVSPGGDWLASVDGYGAVRLWRLPGEIKGDLDGQATVRSEETAPPTYRLGAGATAVKAIAFSRDGKRLAAAGQTKGSFYHDAFVWSLPEQGAPGKPLVLGGHLAPLRTVAFAPTRAGAGDQPGDDRLLVGADDGMISIWNLDSFNEASPENEPPSPAVLSGHTAPVVSLVATNDGLRAASFDADGHVRLWSLEVTSQPPIELTTSASPATLSISPDDRYLVAGGEQVQIWRLDVNDLLTLAQRVAGRELTDDERRQYSLDAVPRAH